jgi:hypothetical protein
MKSINLNGWPPVTAFATGALQQSGSSKPSLRVKELSERDRRRLLMHFLELEENDRLLRFGNVLTD